jgi:hypothetical protein
MVFWFPPNYEKGECHLARTISPPFEKPHTHYTVNMRGPAFILVIHFTPKMKLMTFVKEQGTSSPLKFKDQFTTYMTKGISIILTL